MRFFFLTGTDNESLVTVNTNIAKESKLMNNVEIE